jgi:hypothetical protein
VVGKFAILLPLLAQGLAMGANDLDRDDWEELKRQLPAYIKKSGSMMILPWKTSKGKWQFLNCEYFFPWGNWLNAFRDMKDRDLAEFTRDVGISNPFIDILFMARTGKDDQPPVHPFMGVSLYNQLDPAAVKAAKVVEFLANTWLPTMITRQGALGQTASMLAGREDKWGREVTAAQAAGRWLGVNIVSVSPEQTRAIASTRIQDLRKELYRIQNDPSKTEDEKQAAIGRYRERLADVAAESPTAVLPILKNKGADRVYEALVELLKTGALRSGPPSRTVEIHGIEAKMSMEQYRGYLEKSSEIIHKKLEAIIASGSWEKLPDARRAKIVETIVNNARKPIRSRIKVELLRDQYRKAQEAKAGGSA